MYAYMYIRSMCKQFTDSIQDNQCLKTITNDQFGNIFYTLKYYTKTEYKYNNKIIKQFT